VSPQIDSVAATSSRLVDDGIKHCPGYTFAPQVRKDIYQAQEHRARNFIACPIVSTERSGECHGNGFTTHSADEKPRGGVV
jgi:hypothetical protein